MSDFEIGEKMKQMKIKYMVNVRPIFIVEFIIDVRMFKYSICFKTVSIILRSVDLFSGW